MGPLNSKMKDMMKMAPQLKKAMDETAAEIKAGKYKTMDEARTAMGMKMIPAAPAGTALRIVRRTFSKVSRTSSGSDLT